MQKLKAYTIGAIAQLGERLHGMQEVSGSIPLSSTRKRLKCCFKFIQVTVDKVVKEVKLGPHRLEA